jgi:oxalate decarboxylase
MFRSPTYADVSLNEWIKLTPHALVRAHLKVDEALLDGLPEGKKPVLPA